MTGAQFLTAVNYALRGTDDEAPAWGDEEALYWLAILNRKKNELYEDVTKLWVNTFDGTRSIGTITASSTPSYDLEDDFLAPSDRIYVVTDDSDPQTIYYDLAKPQERTTRTQHAYIAGFDPQILYFSTEILSGDQIVGGTLYVPGYYMPDDVATETATLPFLDPYWAVMAVAAEIAFNDIVYEDRAEKLNSQANNLYTLMVRKNRRGTYANPRTTPTAVTRIQGVR